MSRYLTREDIAVAAAAAEVDTNPTEGQKKAGNYKKGHLTLHGMHVCIENPRGSYRSGTAPNGKPWRTRMAHHYGDIRSTEGADGDPVDVFIGPNPASRLVWVVDQIDPQTGDFDEHKCMLGFDSMEEARAAYFASYEPGWKGLGSISAALSVEEFRDWVEAGEALWAMSLPADHQAIPLAEHPMDTLLATFRGREIRFTAEGWEERPLRKAESEGDDDIPPGAHWITVHPNGKGTKGNAVLVQPIQGHKGTVRIVGGAKGKLNGLRLHGVDTPEEYAAKSKERAQAKRQEEKERKASLSPEEREQEKQEKAQGKAARREAESEFIRKVLGKEGEAQSLFDDEGEDGQPKETHQERLARAKKVAREAERRILLDAESRMQAGLGQIGGGAPLDLHDILDEHTDAKGPGYRRNLAERAAKAGLTAEALAAKVAEIKGLAPQEADPTGRPTPVPSHEEAEANRDAHQDVKALEASKAAAMKQAVMSSLDQHGDLAAILKARSVMRDAFKATLKGKGATFEPGFQMVTSDEREPDQDLVQTIHEKMLTRNVVAFLAEIGDKYPADEVPDPYGVPPEGGLEQARGTGAFDALHETSLAAIGQGVIERDTVEALGAEHSAMIVARAIRHEFTPEDQAQILEALESHHLSEQEKLGEVTEEVRRLKDAAEEMGADIAATPRDFALAVEMGKQKVAVLKEARQLLGVNLGRIEARAALIAALRQPPQDHLQVPLGQMSAEKAVQTAAALGLQDGDYQIEHEMGEAVLHLNPQGQDRLIHPVDQAALGERAIAMALKGGQMDEANWRPRGFADRSATRYDHPLQEPAEFRRQMAPITGDHEHAQSAIHDYAGALMADGHDPKSIVADLYAGSRLAGMEPEARAAYEKALGSLLPQHTPELDAEGNPVPDIDKATGKPILDTQGNPVPKMRAVKEAETAARLEGMLHGYLKTAGEANLTLEGQTVPVDRDFHEAMHRALAADPRATAAFTPVAELTSEQHGHIRDHFYRTYCDGAPNTAAAKQAVLHRDLEALGPEPPKENPDVVGSQMSLLDLLGEEDAGDAAGAAINSAWDDWNEKRAAVLKKHEAAAAAGLSPWAAYVQSMGGVKQAQQAIQDEMRGHFAEKFHEHYQHLTGKALHLDTKEQHRAEDHLKAALGGEQAEALTAERRRKQAMLQKKGGGKFQEGSVADMLKQGAATAAMNQAAGSLFAMDDLEEPAPDEQKEPWQKPERGQGERYTLGRSLEAQLQAHMGAHAGCFAGRKDPVEIREGMHMSGQFAMQQRCVKGIIHLKRIGLFQGAGSGKTAIMQGALAHLHAEGKLTGKAILSVPSVVQGQFGAEAAQFLDPTSGFKLHARPGESWEQRLKAYQDPGTHAVVVTHQTLRDDSIRMLASHLDMSTGEATEHLMGLPKKQAARVMKDAMWAHGINPQAFMADESHNALDRDGKEDSVLSRVFDCHSHNAEYVVQATGDPMKNDVSEVWSDLNKIDPHRWHDGTKDEFMRRYGANAALAKRSMAQELSRYWFNGRVKVDAQAHKRNEGIPLTAGQHERIQAIETAAGKLRTGQGDMVAHAKALAPKAFEGKPEDQHAAIAEKVKKAVGTFRESALNRAINLDPEGGKLAHHVQVAKDRAAEGKPVVIFARNLEAVDQIHAAMEKAGLRSVSLTGKDSSKDKAAKAAQFTGGHADVIVMSDAGSTGLNLQQGKVLIHHDLPNTAMTKNQRDARIHRLGQKSDVEVITAMADHPWERNNLERVQRKDSLGAIFQAPEDYLDDTGLAQTLRDVRSRRAQATGAAA